MSSGKRRVEKLESGLTPKEAFLLWMQEAHSFETLSKYAAHMKTQPDGQFPIPKLADQVAEAVEKALNGKPKEEVSRAVRQAQKDVCFLFHLHQQVNAKFLSEERYYLAQASRLATELNGLLQQQAIEGRMRWNRVRVGLELPFPLDSETAAAVEAAMKHHVLTWELLEDGDELDEWVSDSFIAEGKTHLPYNAYGLRRSDQSHHPGTPVGDGIRELFEDSEAFEKFLSGSDYSYGLADVPDAEYEARYGAVLQCMKNQEEPGRVVELPTVPQPFLREVPLVDGDWIDRYIVELAEWGARIGEKVYLIEEAEDSHPLAWGRILDPEDKSEVSTVVTGKLWQQVRRHLARFPGRTREMDGRSCLSFKDYLAWRWRWVRGDLKSGLQEGLTLSRWNQWIEAQGGEEVANIAEVKVGKLICYLDGYRYHVCQDATELAEEIDKRKSILESLQFGGTDRDDEDRFQTRVKAWRDLILGLLVELYTLRKA